MASHCNAEPVVQMQGVTVKYGNKTVLGDWCQEMPGREDDKGLFWTVRRGERWGVFGANGEHYSRRYS